MSLKPTFFVLAVVFVALAAVVAARVFPEWSGVARIVFASWASRLPFRPEEFAEVVDAYASGQLTSAGGVIQLPQKWASLTSNGRVYVTSDQRWGQLFLFRTWKGKGANLRGYIYCSGLAAALPAMGNPTSLGILVPIPDPPGYSGPIEVEIRKLDRPGWYEASRRHD